MTDDTNTLAMLLTSLDALACSWLDDTAPEPHVSELRDLIASTRVAVTHPEFLIVCQENEDYDPDQPVSFPQFLMSICCPVCFAATVVENDTASRWNTIRFSREGRDPEVVVAEMGERGDFEGDEFLCTDCSITLNPPQAFLDLASDLVYI